MFMSPHTMYYSCRLYESHELNRLKRVFCGGINDEKKCIYLYNYILAGH